MLGLKMLGLKNVGPVCASACSQVTIVVVAVPEGLPLAVTISLGYRCVVQC